MTVAADVVEVEKLGPFTAGVGVAIALQTYDLAQISVRYGDAKTLATIATHYTLELSADFLTVTVTPTAALITAIAAGAGDKFFVRRALPVVNDFDESDAFARSKIVRQDDKHTMIEQQLSWGKRDKETQLVASDIADGAVSLTKLAALASTMLIGSIAGGTPAALSPTQVRDQVISVYSKADIDALLSGVDVSLFTYVIPEQYGAIGDGVVDDTTALEAAIASGIPLMIPEKPYLYDGDITIPSNKTIRAAGPASKLILKPGSTNHGLKTGTNTGIIIDGLELAGNCLTDRSDTGSCGIFAEPGGGKIQITNCFIHHWARHGIALDGVTNAKVHHNTVEDMRWGAGILCSRTEFSTDVEVTNNSVSRVQQGSIHAYFGVKGWRVMYNYCDGTDAGVTVAGGGEVADPITSYVEDATGSLLDAVVIGNICLNSGNNGMHLGGDRLTISGNIIVNPINGGIVVAKADNTTPDPAVVLNVTGNVIHYTTNAGAAPRGINIRNFKYICVCGNTVDGAQVGVELNGLDTTGDGVSFGGVFGNTITMYDTYGIWLRNKVKGLNIHGNDLTADATSSTNDIREDLVSAVQSDNFVFNNTSRDADTVYGQMLRAPGSGVIAVGNENGEHLRVGSASASVVNGWAVAGNGAGSPPILSVRGSDTDIDAFIATKGTGVLRFGVHTALAAETLSGYITIKDAGGALRKVAIIS